MTRTPQFKASLLLLLVSGALWFLLPPGSGLMARAFLERHTSGEKPPAGRFPVDPVLAEENARLQGLLSLSKRLEGQTVLARVTNRAPDSWWSQMGLVLEGESELPSGTAMVLTAEGLLGTVSEGSFHTAQGRTFAKADLLTTPGRQISVLVGIKERPYLLQGQGTEFFSLRAVTSNQATLSPGAVVKTAGQGQQLARGLVVGQVTTSKETATLAQAPAATPAEVLLWWR